MDTERLLPKRSHVVRTERPCTGCGELAWMSKTQRYCSKACSGLNHRGENSPSWKGGDISYRGLHNRVTRERGDASTCYNRELGLRDCTSTSYGWALLHGNDPLDPLSYISLCVSCHNRYDYRGGKAGVPRPGEQGSKDVNAKLNEAIAREVRSRPVSYGSSVSAWAREFGVSKTTMQRVVNGESYCAA